MKRVPYVKTELCTGCDVCIDICPDVFELNEDLVAVVVNPEGDSEESIQEAIDMCPENCILWR